MQDEGNLRTSHRETNPVKRKVAPKQIQQRAREFVESASKYGCIIRQRLDIERMKQPLQKGVFYAIENEGNSDPGFLVFLPGQAPVFLQMKPKAPPPCTLRMRVSTALGEGGGSVLIATLDSIQHTLRLEDVWVWKGTPVFDTEAYSKRREYLKQFVENYWIPDKRLLGGIETSILNPKCLKDVFEVPTAACSNIELIPEAAGRRRMWMNLESGNSRPPAPAPIPVSVSARGPGPIASVVPSAPQKEIQRKARAVAVEKMPDIYDLFDEQGFPISRASVQQFSLAQQLRESSGQEGVWVMVRWRNEFGGYEIISKISSK